jgi:hypothetical protein
MVVYIYNPSYFRNRDKRIVLRGQTLQKVSKTPFPDKAAQVCNPSYAGGAGRRTILGGSQAKL